MWSRSELETELRQAELGRWALRLVELARHSVVLVPGKIEEAVDAPLGASRLGGHPDMLPQLEWPLRPAFRPMHAGVLEGPVPGRLFVGRYHWLHRLFRTQKWKRVSQNWERRRHSERRIRERAWPMSFVAQIDFGEVHALCQLDGLPRSGRLLVFCDALDLPWGKKDDQPRARIIFVDEGTDHLERRPPPPELNGPDAMEMSPRGLVFGSRTLRPTPWLLPPPPESAEISRLRIEDPSAWSSDGATFLAYLQFWDDLYARFPETFGLDGYMIHQVGGLAFSIQRPVETECARFGGGSPDDETWRLVLQIDSDIEIGMEWGDVGRLYVCAREDLLARRFDRCWTIIQCF